MGGLAEVGGRIGGERKTGRSEGRKGGLRRYLGIIDRVIPSTAVRWWGWGDSREGGREERGVMHPLCMPPWGEGGGGSDGEGLSLFTHSVRDAARPFPVRVTWCV